MENRYYPTYDNLRKIWSALGYLQKNSGGGTDASALTTGILDDARLSSNVVFKTNTQTLTNKTLTSPVITNPTGLTKNDVGLGNIDNTSDATKNAASVILTNKTLTSPVINSPTGLVKADVGLSNVDNTADANKQFTTSQIISGTFNDARLSSNVVLKTYSTIKEKAFRLLDLEAANKGVVAMTTPPTITLSASDAAKVRPADIWIPATDTNFTYYGSKINVHNQFGTNWDGYATTPVPLYYAGNTFRTGTLGVSFGYAGRYIELCVFGAVGSSASKGARIWINGQPTAIAPRTDIQADTVGTGQYYEIDFGTVANRSIYLELDYGNEFGGVIRQPDYPISYEPLNTLKFAAIGDSWFSSVGATVPMTGMIRKLAEILNVKDMWQLSEGGIGYATVGGTTGQMIGQKLTTDYTPYDFDWVIIGAGLNDYNKVAATVQSNLTSILTTVLAKPNTIVTVITPFTAPTAVVPQAITDAIVAACNAQTAAIASKRLMVFNQRTENWNYGTGRTTATSGIGTSNWVIGSDGLHPVQVGHEYEAARMKQAIIRHAQVIIAN